jgi:galactokinase
MQALNAALGLRLPATQIAALCQAAENHVVGSPCGIMDQMAAATGQAGHLMVLRCHPADLQGHARVPRGLRFWAIDSGTQHRVSGHAYGSVRTAAFMGRRILSQLLRKVCFSTLACWLPICCRGAITVAA